LLPAALPSAQGRVETNVPRIDSAVVETMCELASPDAIHLSSS
jgi:hypothetical protein